LVVGPGHGAPAVLASLWLEGSLGHFWPEYSQNMSGLRRLITGFSTPGGFPSHVSAETPGSIHEGGELGYALSVAYGAVMDKPDLVVTCIVGGMWLSFLQSQGMTSHGIQFRWGG